MQLTIDTSAILSVLLNEPSKSNLIKNTQGAELITPKSLDAEIGNANSAMFKRSRIDLETATELLSIYKTIPVERQELRLVKAIEISNEFNIYAYDAYMLDCAIQFNAPLLSLDQKLIEIAVLMNIPVIEV